MELPQFVDKPLRVKDAVSYVLKTPGKRFRALLTIAVADLYKKGHLDQVLKAAGAVECVHNASLVFDDLPCMDNATLRRGKKPVHLVFGEDQAILAAMCLIAEANKLLCQPLNDRRSGLQNKLECLAILNEGYSMEGLSGGQSNDLHNNVNLSVEELEYIHSKKTGSLFIASVELAAVLCGARAQERHWLKNYARNLGLAFQIRDDLMDLERPEITGKNSGQDEEKTTFVKILGVSKSRVLYEELMDSALKNLAPFGGSAFHLTDLTQVIRKRNL